MNNYVDIDYYLKEYKGTISNRGIFEKNLLLAKEKIDEVTNNKIIAKGFNNLTTFQKDNIKKAMCYQIDYIVENGVEECNVSSYSVLDISITTNNAKRSEAQKRNMSTTAYSLLKKTGLTNRRFS